MNASTLPLRVTGGVIAKSLYGRFVPQVTEAIDEALASDSLETLPENLARLQDLLQVFQSVCDAHVALMPAKSGAGPAVSDYARADAVKFASAVEQMRSAVVLAQLLVKVTFNVHADALKMLTDIQSFWLEASKVYAV